MSRRLASMAQGWNRFWFAPRSTAPVELFRIAFGAVATLWTLSLIPIMNVFFGPDAAVPVPELFPGAWTLLTLWGGSAFVWVLWALGLGAALALTAGFRTRLAAVLVFVTIVSLTRWAPFGFNSGDGLLRVLAFYMLLMPAGSAVSVDRWLSDRQGLWTFPTRAPWALRLVQIQLSFVYLGTVWEKSGGELWRNGDAVSFSMRIADIVRTPVPHFVTDSAVASQALTFGTLALELALGVLVWNRAARPVVLCVGIALHLSIEVTFRIGFFSAAMLTMYLAFLPTARAESLVCWCRDRLAAPRHGARSSDSWIEPAHHDRMVEPEESNRQLSDR